LKHPVPKILLCRLRWRTSGPCWPLRSKRFGAWLRQHYYERTWDAPSPAALNAALNVLEAQAQFDGPQRKVAIRLAEHEGLIYLDLADEFWRCIEIGANGWRIASAALEVARPALPGCHHLADGYPSHV
jgi:hypothetical protein